ncbi:SDR family oxidoreductase [Kineococcus rhizosphaerae]|uniref:Phosphoserine phosphatase n=1 Tax=Kineococcus rhizosphaerae TaxID=559628 RepID=A0A2T0R6I7_9ACTN|nr:SDR family oxidoreductase [Kineococcus rhizosphaerae]PRY16799.1 phosphoserine phosphatase [Kineococcus rhizosphaerae]
MRLAEQLDGKRFLLTGVTGFIGEALLQRLLVDLPGTTVVALVRPKPGQSGEDRLRSLLRKPIFRAAGDADDLLKTRVEALEGDLSNVPELPADIDVVVHCAGDVSFDPLIQDAFTTNVVGTRALVERTLEANERGHGAVHYVHVSTAYVGGRRRGAVPERAVEHSVDWRSETESGLRLAARIEEDSRLEERLKGFLRAAERDHGRAGPLSVAAGAEERRVKWVVAQQKAAGLERARTLGWTDCYTFTKAMGERLVEEVAAPVIPTTILRPSIVESAVKHPSPGWIEGFKMAEPIILAYGRGELTEFPAAPDSVMDVVPIDHVVNAILKASATPPPLSRPAYYHVSSGARNPLTFREIYEYIREYFTAHPFDSSPAVMPTWDFPGGRAVERKIRAGELLTGAGDRLLAFAPRSRKVREASRKLDGARRQIDFARRYMDLYKAYTEAELRFVDDNTLALHRALDPADVELFGFDTSTVDWRHYWLESHCPSVTTQMRKYEEIRRRRTATENNGPRALRPAGEGGAPVLAVFDLAGTLLPGTVVDTYLTLRLSSLDAPARIAEFGRVMRHLPGWIAAERRDRGSFLRSLFRGYAGVDLDALEQYVDDVFAPDFLASISSDALRRIQAHRDAGHRTVLMTGDVRQVTRPLAGLFDEVVCTELDEQVVDGTRRASGFLTSPPLVGEARAAWVRRYAEVEGADLSASYAYADSHVDLPLLKAVGNPTAVSPDVPLFRVARGSRWPVADWAASSPTRRLRVPQQVLAGTD